MTLTSMTLPTTFFRSAAVAAGCCGAAVPASAQVSLQTVVLSGDAAAGGVFDQMSAAAITDAGVLTFAGDIVNPSVPWQRRSALWAGTPGALGLVVEEGGAAPGVTGAFFEDALYGAALAETGVRAWYGQIRGPGVTRDNDYGLWRSAGPGVTPVLIAREGGAAPGAGGRLFGEVFASPAGISPPLLSRGGWLCFQSQLSDGESGIWRYNGTTLASVAISGETVPGWPDPLLALSPLSGRMSTPGHLVFAGSTIGGLGFKSVVWRAAPGSAAAKVAADGDPVAGFPGASISSISFSEDPGVNDAGHVSFGATASGPGFFGARAVFAGAPGSLRVVVKSGAAAAGTPGEVFDDFTLGDVHAINGQDRVTFHAKLRQSLTVNESNDEGIWAEDAGGMKLVYREGSPAPGAGGAVFAEHPSSLTGFQVNGRGDVVFSAWLNGPGIVTTNDQGVWISEMGGDLSLIVREGDPVQVRPGDFRVVRAFRLGLTEDVTTSGGQDGVPRIIDDQGRVIIVLEFTDDSTAVMITSSGCPADLSGDGLVDFADYLEFLNLFDAGDPRVDFNMDGVVDFADYLEFLNLFDAGC